MKTKKKKSLSVPLWFSDPGIENHGDTEARSGIGFSFYMRATSKLFITAKSSIKSIVGTFSSRTQKGTENTECSPKYAWHSERKNRKIPLRVSVSPWFSKFRGYPTPKQENIVADIQ